TKDTKDTKDGADFSSATLRSARRRVGGAAARGIEGGVLFSFVSFASFVSNALALAFGPRVPDNHHDPATTFVPDRHRPVHPARLRRARLPRDADDVGGELQPGRELRAQGAFHQHRPAQAAR